jgi:predicted Fe-Mo cluster-binding NifX family protein
MKVALSTSGKDLQSPLDPRFGRAPRFIVCDLDTETFTTIDNEPNLNAVQGAGVQSAETVARTGADCLVTGHCGPKAFRVLAAAGVKVYTVEATTVKAALDGFRSGRLTEITVADVESHWG